MTAHTYGYKDSSNICYISSKLVLKKKGNLSKLDVLFLFILGLAANAEPDFAQVQNIRWSS